MNPNGLTPWKIQRWGGHADWDSDTQIPNGMALKAQHSRFRAESVATRFGRQNTMLYAVAGDVTGLECINVLAPYTLGQVPLVWLSTDPAASTLGILLKESPAGSGTLVQISQPIPLPSGGHLVGALAFNRCYFTITDYLNGLTVPMVYDGPSGNLTPVGQNPTGALWAPKVWYQVGDLVRAADGRWWRCTLASTVISGPNPPSWPAFNGNFNGSTWEPSIVTDSVSHSQWEEWTPTAQAFIPAPDVLSLSPTITDNPGSGTIASGKDVYIKFTYVVPSEGEGPRSSAVVFSNTGANDQITVTFLVSTGGGPLMPRWLAEINLAPGLFNPLLLNVWIAIVATGASAPADSAYGLYSAEGSVGAAVVISSSTTIGSNTTGVTGVTVTNNHTYLEVPDVSFSGGGGTGATGYVTYRTILVHTGGTFTPEYIVTGVVVTKPGQNYTGPPAVVFSPTGATATASIGTVGTTGTNYPQNATIVGAMLQSSVPNVFIGESGTRFMIVLRQNANGSLSPADPGSPIPVAFQGEIEQQIITIVRDGSGNVSATVGDVRGYAPNQTINVVGCTGVTTFNGSFVLTNVQMTLAPEGILSWIDAGHASNANDQTGQVVLPAGPPPVAFLPPGGTTDIQDIAGFTVAAPLGGEAPANQQAGPFTYIAESVNNPNFQTQILSMEGPLNLTFTGVALTRDAGGMVSASLANIAGITTGSPVTVSGASDASFDFGGVVAGVSPGTGTAGVVTWVQADTAASTATGATVDFGESTLGQVQATVLNAAGLSAGSVVEIAGVLPSGFNGPVTLASVNGNVVTFPSDAAGAATVSSNSTMTLLQDLPTVAASGSTAITSISRDAKGNVQAIIPDLGGWTAGQQVVIAGVTDATFDGDYNLQSAVLNNDGLTGTVAWVQPNAPGASNSSGGTLSTSPVIIVNFDDNTLSNGADVTNQLVAIPPPPSIDVAYSKNQSRMVYTPGGSSTHYFSNINDPENIQNPDNILAVDQSDGKKTICFREMQDGELLSLKENGARIITPSDLPPSQWGVASRWDGYGPVGPDAAKVGPDFLIVFARGTGPHRYAGGQLKWIGHEKQGTWDKVNWDYAQECQVEIDEDNMRVFFGVPLKPSTTVNYWEVLDYSMGWEDPLIVMLDGSVKPNRYARRWSEWPLTARKVRVMKRTLQVGVDARINKQQTLFGMAGAELDLTRSVIQMEVPDIYQDDGLSGGAAATGIDWQYIPAYARSEERPGGLPDVEINQWEQILGRARGNGTMNLTIVAEDPTFGLQNNPSVQLTVPAGKTANTPVKFSVSFQEHFERELASVNFNNGAMPGAWGELHKVLIMFIKKYPCRDREKSFV